MAVQISAAARQAEVDANCALHNAGKVEYYTGTPPATIELAATGVKTAIFTLPNPAFASATDDGSTATAAANPIATTNAIAGDGVTPVTYYRSYSSGGVDPTDCLKQGTITGSGGGGDMEITNPAITNGEPLSIGSWTYSQPRQ